MMVKTQKYAFTSKALIESIKLYGEKLFTIADKIYVVENALITSPLLRNIAVRDIHYTEPGHYEEVAY
jgi:hypothetical protein